VATRHSRKAVILDTRPAAQFGAGHIPGSIHIALCGQYASWAGTLLGLEKPVVIVADDAGRAEEARLRLARVGLDKTVGYLHDGVRAWQQAGLPLEDVPQISVLQLHEELRERPDAVQVVDVRRPGEWAAGHIGQAHLKPLHKLRTLLGGLNSQKPLAVYCKSGYRSSIGTSLLQGAGFKQVMNVVGGFDAWEAHKLPTVI
jgi:hydroxyacylglutathione hydrolase